MTTPEEIDARVADYVDRAIAISRTNNIKNDDITLCIAQMIQKEELAEREKNSTKYWPKHKPTLMSSNEGM